MEEAVPVPGFQLIVLKHHFSFPLRTSRDRRTSRRKKPRCRAANPRARGRIASYRRRGSARRSPWCGSPPPCDRKSVVWGKSVSVSVDLGGRGTIKKKKNKKEQ